ncbi:hypothetical protein [Sandarakinorhabdus rubra]|uniref:hypothetical protein n=1 Tax=Sandarakinorhabdus rubra TaxID=2672568 RepID=UPI001F1D750F|nr:hypothetical protein [Sandarakinorhabdus rubra]
MSSAPPQAAVSDVVAPAASPTPSFIRSVDWIWRVRGQLALPAGQSPDTAIERLAPLFDEPGTSIQTSASTLAFIKKDPPAQDKLAVFDAGVLSVDDGGGSPVLRYDMSSRFLLACFLAPFMFFAFGQIGLAAANYQKAKAEAEEKTAKKPEKKKPEMKDPVLHPVDAFLGAPAPKTAKEMKAEREKKKKEPPSAKPAYVFTGIFAFLYVLGRILEEMLARRQFSRRLTASDA